MIITLSILCIVKMTKRKAFVYHVHHLLFSILIKIYKAYIFYFAYYLFVYLYALAYLVDSLRKGYRFLIIQWRYFLC